MKCALMLSLTCLGVLGIALPAEAAKKKVVILSFSGPGGAAARKGLARGLARQATQVRPAAFQSAAASLGASADQPDGIAAICGKLKCDAVIKGSVAKKGRRFTLTVTVHDGGTGEVIGRRQAAVRGQRRLAAAGAAVGAQCAALVAQGKFRKGGGARQPEPVAQPQPQPQPTPEPAPQPDKVPEYKPDKVAQTTGKSRRRSTEEGDEGGEGGEGEGGGDDEEGVSKRATRSYAGLFDIAVAVGLAMRSAELTVTNSTKEPPEYEAGLFPEITIRATFFPLVLATKSFFKNIGIGLEYSHHLSISTRLKYEPDSPAVGTSSQEFLSDIRLHWVILKRPTSPAVTGLVGFGLRDFDLDANAVMPSMNFKFIRIGLEGTVPFGTPYIGLGAGFEARVLLSVGAGEVSKATWHLGKKTGGFGFGVRGGLQGRLALGITYFVGVEFLRFGLDFAGLAAEPEPPKDPKPPDQMDPSSLVDQYIRFWAGAGYPY